MHLLPTSPLASGRSKRLLPLCEEEEHSISPSSWEGEGRGGVKRQAGELDLGNELTGVKHRLSYRFTALLFLLCLPGRSFAAPPAPFVLPNGMRVVMRERHTR